MIHIPKVIKGRPKFLTMAKTPIPNESDIGRVCSIMWEVFKDKGKTKLGNHPWLRTISRLEGTLTLEDILNDMLKVFRTKRPSENQIIDSFNMDYPKQELLGAFPHELKL